MAEANIDILADLMYYIKLGLKVAHRIREVEENERIFDNIHHNWVKHFTVGDFPFEIKSRGRQPTVVVYEALKTKTTWLTLRDNACNSIDKCLI